MSRKKTGDYDYDDSSAEVLINCDDKIGRAWPLKNTDASRAAGRSELLTAYHVSQTLLWREILPHSLCTTPVPSHRPWSTISAVGDEISLSRPSCHGLAEPHLIMLLPLNLNGINTIWSQGWFVSWFCKILLNRRPDAVFDCISPYCLLRLGEQSPAVYTTSHCNYFDCDQPNHSLSSYDC